jgi:RNA polymerase sigma-70 factor (ECF subfamily)
LTAQVRASTASDPTLVERARAGDAEAFERLLDASLARAYRTALAILRTDWDASDACQEAFVAAWRGLPRLRDASRFDAWLDRIVVNECRALLRRRRGRPLEIALEDDSDRGSNLTLQSAVDQVADEELVRDAFAKLSPDQRTVLALHHAEGRPVAEIGRLLGVPAGTVMWRLFRARRALEKELREASA